MFIKFRRKHFRRISTLQNMMNTVEINYKTSMQTKPTCNCRAKNECLLKGNCLQNNILYQATLKSTDNEEKYAHEYLKDPGNRNQSHKTYLTTSKYANSTMHSKHIWIIKTKNKKQITPKIQQKIWKIPPSQNKS